MEDFARGDDRRKAPSDPPSATAQRLAGAEPRRAAALASLRAFGDKAGMAADRGGRSGRSRRSSGSSGRRLIAGLARMVRDVDRAEELAQDALADRARRMADARRPDNPGAWLMAAAKRRAIDGIRRDRMLDAQARRDRAANSTTSATRASKTSRRRWTTISATSCSG